MRKLLVIILTLSLLSVVSCTAIKNVDVTETSYQPSIGIISAMDSELAFLLDNANIISSEEIGGVTYHYGTLHDKYVVLVRAGVGKTRAAAATAVMLSRYDIQEVIFTGIAGGVGENVKLLDVVIGTKLITHDYGDMTNNGFEWAGFVHEPIYPTSTPIKKYVDLAYEVAVGIVGEDRVHRGTIVTGDQFIASDSYVNLLQREFDALACEMEGASVALICDYFNVPVIVIRAMSDKADGLAHEFIDQWWITASDISAEIVFGLIEKL